MYNAAFVHSLDLAIFRLFSAITPTRLRNANPRSVIPTAVDRIVHPLSRQMGLGVGWDKIAPSGLSRIEDEPGLDNLGSHSRCFYKID